MNSSPEHRPGDSVEESMQRSAAEVLARLAVPATKDVIRPQISALLDANRIEKLSKLKPRFLDINPDDPEHSPDIISLETLYTNNLVPDDAFQKLMQGDHVGFNRAMERGGMLNRFQPSPREMAAYPKEYQSVKDQVIADLNGTAGRPGHYKILGLFDDQNVLRSSLSYRMPPRKDESDYAKKIGEYVAYLHRALCDPKLLSTDQISYSAKWDQDRMKAEFPSMWEIDTINVEQGWGGAGLLAMEQVIAAIKQELGELPKAVYCYRYDGIRVLEDNEESTGYWTLAGPNRGSRNFLEDLGFDKMAERIVEGENVIREIDGEIRPFSPQWSYHYCGRNTLERNLNHCMIKAGLRKKS